MRNKVIEIKNIRDYKKFLKRIKRYKSFLYKNTNFSCDSNVIFKDVTPIINSLNIKNRKKRIKYVYDYCCKYIDDYCANKNFCKFKNNKCLNQYDNEHFNGCCRGCRYQSNKGCTTSNLTCKLFYCSSVKENSKVIEYSDLTILKTLSLRNRIIIKHNYFVKREDFLHDLYYCPLLAFSFKTLFRLKNIKKQY